MSGQGCVVQQGIVLAVEAAEGTDAMLARCAALARPGPGGVLVKLVKPGQDRRADLPTIGPETLRGAADAGLRGVAFEAGGTILAERAADGGGGGRGRAVSCSAWARMSCLRPGERTHEPLSAHHAPRRRPGAQRRFLHARLLGMKELRRRDVPDGKYTLAFVGYGDEDSDAVIELTYNYGVESYEHGQRLRPSGDRRAGCGGGLRERCARRAARSRARPGR